jgi:hypothetical protein
MIIYFYIIVYQHFHLRSARVFLVGSPFGFLAGPLTPDILAQKERFLAPP